MQIKDLKELFNKCNEKYFENKVQDVPIKICNSKSGGYVKAERVNNIIVVQSLSISKAYNYTKDQLEKIMVHEMIHVYLFQQNIKHGHCYKFKAVVEDIFIKYNFEVPMKLFKDIEPIKTKTKYFIKFKKFNDYFVLFTSLKNKDKYLKKINAIGYEIEKSGSISSPKLMKFKSCRSRLIYYDYNNIAQHINI